MAREYLIDVSRLIWRAWRGRPATGIDRVCLAYLDRFGGRAQAIAQRKGLIRVLSPGHSDRLFRLLGRGQGVSKRKLAARLAAALPTARVSPPREGMIYLNVGHTGLDSASLPHWIAQHRAKAVFLIHDLIPLTHPQFCRAGEAEKHERRMLHALRCGGGIIGNSQDTLVELARFARSRGLDMPPSTAAWISGYEGTKPARPRSLDRSYFVTVGTIEARKNHLTLLRAWDRLVAEMRENAPLLIIIGHRGWEAEEVISRLDHLGSLGGHVREISSCRDEELAAWIAGARALLMPSFVEGFGLPVVEALALGTPVIASALPVYREIVGEIPTYLDPGNSEAWAEAIKNFVNDGMEGKRQRSRMECYRAPTWEDHFQNVEPWLATL